MSKVDFHIHTKFSDDGEFSPGEIVRQCEAEGMEWIAVTDHNSVRGVPKAMEEAVSVRVISGVELDCASPLFSVNWFPLPLSVSHLDKC